MSLQIWQVLELSLTEQTDVRNGIRKRESIGSVDCDS